MLTPIKGKWSIKIILKINLKTQIKFLVVVKHVGKQEMLIKYHSRILFLSSDINLFPEALYQL